MLPEDADAGEGENEGTPEGEAPPTNRSEQVEDAASPTPSGEEEAPPAGGDSEEPPPITKEVEGSEGEDWRDKRFRKENARRKEAEERLAALEAENAALKSGTKSEGYDEEEVNRLANERAKHLAAQREFADKCNHIAEVGRKEFDDFDARIKEIHKVVDGEDPTSVAQFNQILAAAIETGDGAKVLHRVGGDKNLAARLMEMSPLQLGITLTKLANEKSAAEPSGAPAPIKPIGSRGGAREAIDPSDPEKSGKLSTADWIKRRNEQIERKNAEGSSSRRLQ
jgi:hypothetical protein